MNEFTDHSGDLNDDEPYDDEAYGRTDSPSPAVNIRHGVGQIVRDAVTLAELQAQLLQVDLRNWMTTTFVPAAALAAVAVVALLATLPVLLVSLAYYLVDAANLTLASALLAAAGIGLVAAAICATLAWRTITRSRGAFTRFRTELARNVQWLKQVLGRPSETADSLAPPDPPPRRADRRDNTPTRTSKPWPKPPANHAAPQPRIPTVRPTPSATLA